jgi:bla regulator protein blaR1
MDQITQSLFEAQSFIATGPATITQNSRLLPQVLLFVWACGILILAFSWARNWWRLQSAVRAASPLAMQAGVPVLSSPSLLEPGIFGILKPVMMLPRGITDRLNSGQMRAIVAHEMCHVRRRDNLTFAMHMAVETIFWFHPLVWWLRTRLIEERERACDEAVLQSGSEAEVYAEGILNVCKFYVESPLACVSGVTGSDLKQRIVRIMTERLGDNLSMGRKLLLGTVATAAIALPVVFGLAHTTQIFAQTKVEDSPANLLEFEVVSIKPNKSGDNRAGFLLSKGGLSLSNVPVQMLLREAFNVNDERIFGSPNWAKSDRFDVEAKVSEADLSKLDSLSPRQRTKMLLPLLQDRINLKYHHETREMPVYSVVVAKGGLKLKESTVPSNEARGGIRMNGPGDFEGMNVTLALLCHVLSEQPELAHSIIDKTGLAGNYDFHLQWRPEIAGQSGSDANSVGAPVSDANKPGLFTALQEELGLKLEPQKGPVDVIVIDHIEAPSPN